jgi:hypothetical protein
MRVCLALILLCCARVGLAAQQPAIGDPPASTAPAMTSASPSRTPRRIFFGMWTWHLKQDVVQLRNNWVAGVSVRGFYGATFMNSFGRRAYTIGIERPRLFTFTPPVVDVSIGYRAGLISGYDRRLMKLAEKTPILPYVQPVAAVNYHRLGVEVSYTFVVVSLMTTYQF